MLMLLCVRTGKLTWSTIGKVRQYDFPASLSATSSHPLLSL